MDLEILKEKKLSELKEIAAALQIDVKGMKKQDILDVLIGMHNENEAAKTAKPKSATAKAAGAKTAGAQASASRHPSRKTQTRKNTQASETSPVNSEPSILELAFRAPIDAAAPTADTPTTVSTATSTSEELQASETSDSASNCEPSASPASESSRDSAASPAPESSRDSAASQSDTDKRADNKYETTGILDLAEGGFGFLRFNNFLTSDADVYVSPTQIRRFGLKTGDAIEAVCRKPSREKDEKFGAVLYVKSVNGEEPGSARNRRDFSDLTPIYPNERIRLEKGSNALSMRMADIIAPIGKGQRGLIVAPPKAGKTTLLKQIAKAIENQNTEAELIVLLIDERPEEVTDMQESINGRVIYSTFDEQPAHHVKVAEMVLARAQRLAEHGKDVIILLDSITRLARAYNLVEPPSGRTLSGGLDPSALYKPKKFFGAARNLKEGGSITILATALIETGSRMDDMIFEEFKGTGNMELHLDRNMAEKRIFPAINLNKSGTRREDMLLDQSELEGVWLMRRALSDWGPAEATERIVMQMAQSRSNKDFIERFRKTVI